MLLKVTRVLALVAFLAGLIVLPAAAATSFGISGTVLAYGLYPLKGVMVSISGTAYTATTSSTGNYHIGSIPTGTSGTLVPPYPNYAFTPASITFPALTTSLTGQNFNGHIVNSSKYSISGAITLNGVGLANATVNLTTSVTHVVYSAVTDALGAYTLTAIPAATTGHITVKASGYAFSPSFLAVTNLSGNLTNQNFTAAPMYTISGVVYDQATGWYLGGVTVTCGSQSAVSSATNGVYSIHNLPPGTNCALTPSLSGKIFWPAPIAISNLQANLRSQNFVAVP